MSLLFFMVDRYHRDFLRKGLSGSAIDLLLFDESPKKNRFFGIEVLAWPETNRCCSVDDVERSMARHFATIPRELGTQATVLDVELKKSNRHPDCVDIRLLRHEVG
jgi:hypothetical protein